MSVPTSPIFAVQAIPGAGRGVIASCAIEPSTVLFESNNLAAHVIFRQYRREVCAQCFHYDRGRTLPVRDSAIGKVFCTEECSSQWQLEQGDLGFTIWTSLENCIKANAKTIINVYAIDSSGTRPTEALIESSWAHAEENVHKRGFRRNSRTSDGRQDQKHTSKPGNARKPTRIDPDLLSYFVSGVLSRHQDPNAWQEAVEPLARDPQPYKSVTELDIHCEMYSHLFSILPQCLHSVLTPDLCQTLVNAASYNSFGIRSGGEDAEEYMGYALYPFSSYFNHSCEPNVTKKRLCRTWEFRSAEHVGQGEELCITYLGGDEKDMSVRERRERLAEVWGFTCACKRCIRESS